MIRIGSRESELPFGRLKRSRGCLKELVTSVKENV